MLSVLLNTVYLYEVRFTFIAQTIIDNMYSRCRMYYGSMIQDKYCSYYADGVTWTIPW